jgi:SAM-dependent methyltransferase
LKSVYIHTEEIHNLKSPTAIVPLVQQIISPESVLDVGCGTGTWLKVFQDYGVRDVLGIDGDYVDLKKLKISSDKFLAHDLRRGLVVNRKFDLVISLEVAEHLPESSAEGFIASLVRHGDTILFSAAIPGQGGQDHINEQWPAYWQSKFEHHGFYCHDILRSQIWDNKDVDWWYKQNLFLVSKTPNSARIPPLVHPDCLQHNQRMSDARIASIYSGALGIMHALRILRAAVFKKFQ